MTVYVVTQKALYSTKIVAVFDSRAKAEKFVKDEEETSKILSWDIVELKVK